MKLSAEIKNSVPYQFAVEVRDGKIITGQYIRLAVDRFFKWIKNSKNLGFTLDHQAGMHMIEFFEQFILHTKGPLAGKPMILSPYQQFTWYNIMAWKKRDEAGNLVRVIRTVYEKVARKNGKTAVLAGAGLYFQSCEDEGAEIYVGATKELQAKVLWEQASQFVAKGIQLRMAGFKSFQREIRYPKTMGYFRFLGGDSKTLDGLNPSLSIIDEYHAHKDDSVKEVLESAMGARLQPLTYIITTAGFNSSGVCKAYEDVCKNILKGDLHDDSTLIMIHDLDEGDDWQDQSAWVKANPNLNVSIGIDYLRDEYTKAINQPSKLVNFKTKHLNQWTDAAETWIPSNIWEANKTDESIDEKLRELGHYSGLDLANTRDICSYALLSNPDEKGNMYLKAYHFCPADTIEQRSKEDRVPYRYWAQAGYIITTPGNTADYDYIEDVVAHNHKQYKGERLGYDRKEANQIIQRLTEREVTCTPFSQAIGTISWPTKQFEKLVYEGKIKHDGNPVLRWMLAHCVIYQDPNENIKVHKGQSHAGKGRVDGIIASIMALGEMMTTDEDDGKNKYMDPNAEVYV